MEEIWKDIEGYEGLYQVSNLGRVKKLPTILKNSLDKQGYEVVQLVNENGKKKVLKIHRLVANAFIENTENKPQVDHINTIRNDNRVENLRWVTPKENMNNPITLLKFTNKKTA